MKQAASIIAIFLLSAAGASAEVVLSLQGPSSPVNVGSQFSVDVNISGVSDLYAYQFDIGFNPALVSAVLVTEGPFLPSAGATLFVPGSIDNLGGLVSMTSGALTGVIGANGSGTLARLTFQALAEGTSGLSALSPLAYDSLFNSIDVTAQGTTITAEVSAVPEPAAVFLLAGAVGALGLARRRCFSR